jgi:hypothetical protein
LRRDIYYFVFIFVIRVRKVPSYTITAVGQGSVEALAGLGARAARGRLGAAVLGAAKAELGGIDILILNHIMNSGAAYDSRGWLAA